GNAAGADQKIRAHPELRYSEQPQVACVAPHERAHRFHRDERIVRRHRDERAVGDQRREVVCVREEFRVVRRKAHAVPPTVSPSIFSVGWPTPTGTLCPSLPQVPMPVSSSRSLPIIVTRVSASGPLPISVAPFTGCVTLPSSI